MTTILDVVREETVQDLENDLHVAGALLKEAGHAYSELSRTEADLRTVNAAWEAFQSVQGLVNIIKEQIEEFGK